MSFCSLATVLLTAWIPFVNPLTLPPGARLWTLFPLVACIAVVYRATRARALSDLPRATALTFVNIVLGMWAIALVAYGVHQAVLRFG